MKLCKSGKRLWGYKGTHGVCITLFVLGWSLLDNSCFPRGLLVLNWRQKSTARSQLKLTIEDTLDTGLPRAYTPELYNQKCSAVFEHVYESYPERNVGVYA